MRIAELEASLRSVVDMHRDRYACASEWNACFERAREVLEKTENSGSRYLQLSRSVDSSGMEGSSVSEVRCRFGCANPVGVYHVPEGCICWSDPVQALCAQHFLTAESNGPISLLLDLSGGTFRP